jgi:hypothetical protein
MARIPWTDGTRHESSTDDAVGFNECCAKALDINSTPSKTGKQTRMSR